MHTASSELAKLNGILLSLKSWQCQLLKVKLQIAMSLLSCVLKAF